MSSDSVQVNVSLENVDALPLFGQADANLRAIEAAFDVTLASRNGSLQVMGEQGGVDGATRVVNALIARLAKGATITSEDLEYLFSVSSQSPLLERLPESGLVLVGDKKVVKVRSANQGHYVDTMLSRDVVFGVGPAGTGKTYLAVALAVRMLKEKRVDRIVLARPAVEAGERLGYLPGDLQDKIDPYLRPLYDALNDMISAEKLQRFLQLGVIEVVPLAYMRGRTLARAFVILDEAQNATLSQMKMVLTRLGPYSRAVVTGDVTQVDLEDPEASGLVRIQSILEGVPSIGFVYFDDTDVVRHRLVKEIIRAFDRSTRAATNRSSPDE